MEYVFIDEYYADFRIQTMARVLGVPVVGKARIWLVVLR